MSAIEAFHTAGAVSSGVSTTGAAGIHAAAGTLSGGINSAITGGDVGLGAITGGISGGIANYTGSFLPNDFGSQFAGRTFSGGVTGGITAEMYGGDFGQGFTQGAATAAAGFLFNHCAHGGCSGLLEQISNASAGFGDAISMGGTKWVRQQMGYDNVVNYDSGAYTAGEVAGYALDVATGTAGVARAAGWTTRIAVHEAHHTFGSVGKLSHVQMNYWQTGVKGSGGVFRIPLPWR